MLFSSLTDRDISHLSSSVYENDIKHSLFNICGIKALGLDGFPSIFFQKFWGSSKADLINMVSECFVQGCVPSDINQTSMMQFRPISLCNTFYKILSKVLVQRLKGLLPKLVSHNQVAFVPSRQIQDNIVIA